MPIINRALNLDIFGLSGYTIAIYLSRETAISVNTPAATETFAIKVEIVQYLE